MTPASKAVEDASDERTTMRNTTEHPAIPFIKIRKSTVAASLDTLCIQEGNSDTPRPISWQDTEYSSRMSPDDIWSFSIDDLPESSTFRSETEAIEAAEQALTGRYNHIAEQHLQAAIRTGNTPLALAIVECRGYWRGAYTTHAKMAALVAKATSLLEPVTRNYRR